MKRIVFLVTINLILALFQSSFFPQLFGVYYNVNLIFAFAYAFLASNKIKEALISILIGGLILDLLGFSIVGFTSLILTVLLYLAIFIRKYVFKSWVLQVVLVVLADYGYRLILKYPRVEITFDLFLGTVFTVLFTLLFYFLLKSNFYLNRATLDLKKGDYDS